MNSYKSILILLFCILTISGKSQKKIEIPQNKRDSIYFNNITTSINKNGYDNLLLLKDSLVIRIWMGNNIVQINYSDSIRSKLITSIVKDNQDFDKVSRTTNLDYLTSKHLGEALLKTDIVDLTDDNKIGIDGQQYLFEISTPNSYRLYSYWSPHMTLDKNNTNRQRVAEIIDIVSELIDIKEKNIDFFKSIPAGDYRWGLIGIRVDHFLNTDINESSIYETVEQKIRTNLKLNENSSPLNFPLIMIDGRTAFLCDLNKIKSNKVKDISLLKAEDNAVALYGTKGTNGVIIIKTK